ncbi:MAG: hypothetical protein KKG01_00785 [Candidatus Omnitrophica bacterium]|nr:hypothetical protein [Candidatus Omnitrophota bacterium]
MRKIGKGYNVGAGVVIVIMLLTGLVCADALRVPINEEYSRMENLQKIEEISDALKKNTPSGGLSAVVLYPGAVQLAADCNRLKPKNFTEAVVFDLTEEYPSRSFIKKIEKIGESISGEFKYIPVTINGNLLAFGYKEFADMCRNLSVITFYGKIRFVIIADVVENYNGILESGSQFVWEFIPERTRFDFSQSDEDIALKIQGDLILNTNGKTFDDVWSRMTEAGLLKNVSDPRTLPVDPEEIEFVEAYAKMSLAELQEVLKDLISGEHPAIESSVWMLEAKASGECPLLITFIDNLSSSDTEMKHHVMNPSAVITTNKNAISFMKKNNKLTEEREIIFNRIIKGAYKYKALMREITKRWSSDRVVFIKEEGRWKDKAGGEKWYEIHYKSQLRGWVFFESKDNVLTVTTISIPTNSEDWEAIYKATLSELRSIALEEQVEKIHFEKVSNDIFLKYILENFSIEVIKSSSTAWFMPAEGKDIKPWQFLLLPKTDRGVTITIYKGEDMKGVNPVYPFGTGPTFTITEKKGSLVINPSKLRKLDVPGVYDNYTISYDEKEKRFILTQEDSKIIKDVDFQLNEGYLDSDLEIMCTVKPLSEIKQTLPKEAIRTGS